MTNLLYQWCKHLDSDSGLLVWWLVNLHAEADVPSLIAIQDNYCVMRTVILSFSGYNLYKISTYLEIYVYGWRAKRFWFILLIWIKFRRSYQTPVIRRSRTKKITYRCSLGPLKFRFDTPWNSADIDSLSWQIKNRE